MGRRPYDIIVRQNDKLKFESYTKANPGGFLHRGDLLYLDTGFIHIICLAEHCKANAEQNDQAAHSQIFIL